MKRMLVAAVGAAALLLTAVPAAKADFHFPSQACKTATGSAAVVLSEQAGTFTFTGIVTCNGATSAKIASLTLTPVAPPGAAVAANTASATCGPCGAASIVATGTAPSSPGYYEVKMLFEACCSPTGGTYKPTRSARYLFAKEGTLVKVS